MPIGQASQVREIDRISMQKYGISGLTLMKNAAKAVYNELYASLTLETKVCILCGRGNNAGDGFALAPMLVGLVDSVTVVLLCGRSFSPDAKYYFDQLPPTVNVSETFLEADIYVDAVFGTGFYGNLPQNVADAFRKVNSSSALSVAIDVPSGINSDTGERAEDCFKADMTVTFEILKYCHILPYGRDCCGAVKVGNIGLAPQAYNEVGLSTRLLDGYTLTEKNPYIHKGSNGTLYALVGSQRYQGAATLSVMSALRGGCGIVMAFVPRSVYLPLTCKVNGAVVLCCEQTEEGTHSTDVIGKFVEEVRNRPPSAILIGSGMGLNDSFKDVLGSIVKYDFPCVVDGDGLRYVGTVLPKKNTILTPHVGEFSRLCGITTAEIAANRFEICKQYAKENQVILVLKDAITVITAPSGEQWVLCAPNPALAKGGSGDTLAGLIASFLAQGFAALEAAKAGVWFHSLAARFAAEEKGSNATLPEDVIEYFPKAFMS